MFWSAPHYWTLMLTGVIWALSPPPKWLLLNFYLSSSVLLPASELRITRLSMVCTTGWVLGADCPLLCLWETFWGGAFGSFPFSSSATCEKLIASVAHLHRKPLLTMSLLSYDSFELCLLFCAWVPKFTLSQGEAFVSMDVSEHAFGFPRFPPGSLEVWTCFLITFISE